MATPTPDKIGVFYTSRGLQANGTPTERFVDTVTNAMTFTVLDMTEETGFWNGAVGYFLNTQTVALRGQTFHVRDWNRESRTLMFSAPLPTIPVSGDKFLLYAGGKQASTKEVLCMKASGKQPEIESVTGTNVTGVTIKKVSPLLGESTLTLYYTTDTNGKRLQIRTTTLTDYGPTVDITHDVQNLVLYTSDLMGYVIVDIEYSKLSTYNGRSDTFTLTMPKGNMLPNMEGYETNDGAGRSRYHLFALKNKASNEEDVVSGLMLWTGRPAGTPTTLTSSYSASPTASQTMVVANATDWPTRGFWVRNLSVNGGQGDLRYVDYRSGNNLYTKPVIWGWVPFRGGLEEIESGMTISYATYPTYTAVVDRVILSSGNWANADAAGILGLKKWLVNFSFGSGYAINVDGEKYASSNGNSYRGYRDCPAVQWNSGNAVVPASDIDLGIEYPDENGLFTEQPTDTTAPRNASFGCYDDQTRNTFCGPVYAGQSLGIWLRQTILDGTQARQNLEGDLITQYY